MRPGALGPGHARVRAAATSSPGERQGRWRLGAQARRGHQQIPPTHARKAATPNTPSALPPKGRPAQPLGRIFRSSSSAHAWMTARYLASSNGSPNSTLSRRLRGPGARGRRRQDGAQALIRKGTCADSRRRLTVLLPSCAAHSARRGHQAACVTHCTRLMCGLRQPCAHLRFCTQGLCGTYATTPPTVTEPWATVIFDSSACSTLLLPARRGGRAAG